MINKLKEFFLSSGKAQPETDGTVPEDSGKSSFDRIFWLMLSGGIILRLFYLWEYSDFVNFNIACGADVREYYERALGIASGKIFPEKPDIHGIFYPFAISGFLAFTKSVAALRVVQLLLNAGAFAGFYHLLGKYSVPLKVRRIFFALAMFYPVLVFHAGELISETLLIPLMFGVMYLLFQMRNNGEKSLLYSGLAGVIASFAVLTHGSMLFTALLFAAEILREKRKKCAGVFLAFFFAVIGIFILIQSAHYEKFTFVQANGGFNFYLGNSVKADGTCRIRPGLEWRKLHLESEKESKKRGISTDRLFLEKSLDYFVHNPGKALYGFCRKTVMFFHYKELISGSDPAGLVYRTKTVFCGKIFTLPIMILSLIGVFIAWKKREKAPADFLILLIGVLAVNILTVTSGRYRVPAYPSLYLFAAYAVAFIPVKVTAIISVICAVPALVSGYGNNLDPESFRILGEAAYRKKDHKTAFEYLQKISDSNDDPSGVQNMLGSIYEQQQNKDAAIKCYKLVVSLEPERFEAYMNIAGLTPDRKEAEKMFRLAFEKGGNENALCHINYAKFLIRSGNIRSALRSAKNGVQLHPENDDAWNTLAVAYAYSGNLHQAAEAFDAAAKLAPENDNYSRNAAIMKMELQKRREEFMRRRHRRPSSFAPQAAQPPEKAAK